ncbi:MAG: hypothetical protein AAGJ31_04565 [Verrucomicrobiota bacterium]
MLRTLLSFSFLLSGGFFLSVSQAEESLDWLEGTSPAVRQVLRGTGGGDHQMRLRRVEQLTVFSDDDVRAIGRFLRTPAKTGGLISARSFDQELKNAIMNRLRASPVPAEVQFAWYVTIIPNVKIDPVIRDYSAQHAAKLMLRRDCSAALSARIAQLLLEEAEKQVETSVIGTVIAALLQVHHHKVAAGLPPHPLHRDRLLQVAEIVGKAESSSSGSRSAAFAAVGELVSPECPPWIVEWFRREALVPEGGGEEELRGRVQDPLALFAAARVLWDSEQEEHRALVTSYAQGLPKGDVYRRLIEGWETEEREALPTVPKWESEEDVEEKEREER